MIDLSRVCFLGRVPNFNQSIARKHCFLTSNYFNLRPSPKNIILYHRPIASGYGTVEDVTDNLVVIDILFTSTQETEVTELVSYGWGNFLGEYFTFLEQLLQQNMIDWDPDYKNIYYIIQSW